MVAVGRRFEHLPCYINIDSTYEDTERNIPKYLQNVKVLLIIGENNV